MPNNEEYGYEEEVPSEHESYDEGESQEEGDPVLSKISALQEQIAQLQSGFSTKPVTREAPKPVELSDEQYAAIAKDPKLLGQFVKAELSKTTNQIQQQNQKAHFDNLAQEKFPSLKSDKGLQKQVFETMREMVEQTKEFTWDSPTLLLRAAEVTAAKTGGMLDVSKRRSDGMSTLDASNTSVHRNRPTRTKVSDSDPRLKFAELFGIKDPKKLEAFKSQLGPYEAPQRKRGRSLMK